MRYGTRFAPKRRGSTLPNHEAFAVWATCYDTQPNPLLMLEERYLKRLLPEIGGRDVLDTGCGSGRWLSYIADRHPRSLKGIDASDEMLEVARSKGIAAELVNESCDRTSFSSKSFNLILLSFVLSYIDVREPRSLSEWASLGLGANILLWLQGAALTRFNRMLMYFLLLSQVGKKAGRETWLRKFTRFAVHRPLRWRLRFGRYAFAWEIWLSRLSEQLVFRRSLVSGQELPKESPNAC